MTCHLLIILKARFRSRWRTIIFESGLKYVVPNTKKVAQTLLSLIWLTMLKIRRPWCESEKVYPVGLSGIHYFKLLKFVLNCSIQLNYLLTVFTFGYEHSFNPKTKRVNNYNYNKFSKTSNEFDTHQSCGTSVRGKTTPNLLAPLLRREVGIVGVRREWKQWVGEGLVGSVLLSPQLSLTRCCLTNELVSLRTKTLVSSSEREICSQLGSRRVNVTSTLDSTKIHSQ